jgi:drug/metabolite transporter (DMT)-like permease
MRSSTALVALHVAVALFGFAALFGKWIALPPVAIVSGRTVVAAVTLALAARAMRQPILRPNAAFAANGALLALHWATFFAAVQVSSVATGLLGFASFPMFVMVFESAGGRRRPIAREFAAVSLVVVGLALLVPQFSWSSAMVQGLAWGIASGLTFALLTLANRARVSRVGPTPLALWQNAFAALWLVPVVVIMTPHISPAPRDLALLLVLGVFCTALAHTMFIASMLRVSAQTASIVSVLEPVYGIVLAALLLGEIPNLRTLIGGGLIVSAAALATRVAMARSTAFR